MARFLLTALIRGGDRCRACLGLALFALGLPLHARAQDTTGTIRGVVVVKGTNTPLEYSTVSIPSLGVDRFTNDAGAFTLARVPRGRVTMRVRHIGYSPAELSVVLRAGETQTVRVELTRLAVRLATLRVQSYPPCTQPGPPPRNRDSSAAVIFDQLRQNAEQFRLLSEKYPFESTVERTRSRRMRNDDLRVETLDTISGASGAQWQYDEGSLIQRRAVVGSNTPSWVFRIPTLLHFADPRFLANHCFYVAGLEDADGPKLLRIDLRAAARIKAPDVDGSIYLDPTNFQIRRSILTLSRRPPEVLGLESMTVTTTFTEILPSIPVIGNVSSLTFYDPNVPLGSNLVARTEEQRLLRVVFLKGKPGG